MITKNGLIFPSTEKYFPILESAPSSPRIGSLNTKKSIETSNLEVISKALSTSLPDLDSEPWIEVKKRHRPSLVKPKVMLKMLILMFVFF